MMIEECPRADTTAAAAEVSAVKITSFDSDDDDVDIVDIVVDDVEQPPPPINVATEEATTAAANKEIASQTSSSATSSEEELIGDGGGGDNNHHHDVSLKKKNLKKRKSSIFASRSGHALEFDNIGLKTKSKNPKKNPPKHILQSITGKFPPKTLTAVMGPSGSGKTSLLKILTGRIGGSKSTLDLSGSIKLDNELVDPTDIDVRRVIAYVEQDVSIPATCTPREAIYFSARLRLDESYTDAEITGIVNELIDNLGLSKCADTLIGGGPMMTGGLSGGEKKRVQCGVELVTNPEIVVLDEPTSGLDSYSAQNLMDVLKKIADAGATVIVTIHQPPPPVVRKIDNLLLLLNGRKMYIGPMNEAKETFASYNFPKPNDYNIADWILHVAQANPMEELDKAGFFSTNVHETTKKHGDGEITASGIIKADGSHKKKQSYATKNHVDIGVQTKLLFGREIKKLWRDKFSFVVRVMSSVVFGLLFGLIFKGVGLSDYVAYPEVMASFGAIANLLISTMFGVAQSSLMEFPKDRPVFLREYSTNHYSILPYFVSKFTVECFMTFFQVLAQLCAAFFLEGFQMNFFLFLAVNFVLGIASTSIGVVIGSAVENPDVAAELMPALIVPQLLFSGFFIQVSMIPEFLRWAQYLCSLTYAIRLVTLYEFGDCTTGSCQSLLENNGVYELESYWYWIILFAICAIFRVTAIIILKNKATF